MNHFDNVRFADVVHGGCDMVVVLEGDMKDLDKTITCLKKIPYIKKMEPIF